MDGDIRGYFGYFLFSRGCFSTGLLVLLQYEYLTILFDRHKPGAKRGDGGKVKLSNYWTTPDGLRRTIFHEYGVQEESFSSPLNCLITEGGDYCTAHERDRVFGAKYDAYAHSKRGMSIYMNPEYELEDLHKALKWAVATSQEASPFCAVLVLPRYQMASYMRLFSHHNVTLIAKLRKHTFAFMPPDQWETELPDPGALPTAKFPVLIVEVANQLGREQYRSPGAHAAVQAASVAAGAVLVNAPDEAFTRSLSPYTVRPPKGFLRVLRRPRAPAPPGHFGARLTDCCLTEWHARALGASAGAPPAGGGHGGLRVGASGVHGRIQNGARGWRWVRDPCRRVPGPCAHGHSRATNGEQG